MVFCSFNKKHNIYCLCAEVWSKRWIYNMETKKNTKWLNLRTIYPFHGSLYRFTLTLSMLLTFENFVFHCSTTFASFRSFYLFTFGTWIQFFFISSRFFHILLVLQLVFVHYECAGVKITFFEIVSVILHIKQITQIKCCIIFAIGTKSSKTIRIPFK